MFQENSWLREVGKVWNRTLEKLLSLRLSKEMLVLLGVIHTRCCLRKKTDHFGKIRIRRTLAPRLPYYLPFVWHIFTSPVESDVNKKTPLESHHYASVVFVSNSFKVIHFIFRELKLELHATLIYILLFWSRQPSVT